MEKYINIPWILGILLVVTIHDSVEHNQTIEEVNNISPETIARKVADKIISFRDIFLVWDYGGALIFDGLHEVDRTFGTNYHETLNTYLDRFESAPERYGYKILHGIDIPYDDAIGDDLGLFPIAYLNRVLSCTSKTCNATMDQRVVEFATQYILGWPNHLDDNTISRDKGWHSNRKHHPSFVWADDQYMGLTLLARWAVVTKNKTLAEFVAKEAILFANHLRDSTDGLYYHGYDGERKEVSCCKWGRANGWSLMSHVEVLIMLNAFPSLQHQKVELLDILSSHAEALMKYQSVDGRFHQVINESSTYLETSSTAMILTSWTRAVRHGWLNKNTYNAAIWRAWRALISVVKANGAVDGICMPTGVLSSVSEYQQRPCIYLLSGSGGLGAVLQAAVQMSLHDRVNPQF